MDYMNKMLKICVFIFLTVYIIVDVAVYYPRNLVSVVGLIIYIILFFLFSSNPLKINWHPVFWGLALQYIFALIILRTYWGYQAFKWIGDSVTELLHYTDAGAVFVFGEVYKEHFFAFNDTTPAESLNAAGNIFVGMTQAGLIIRPYLNTLTMSELFAVTTGGFSTVAGSVLGAYIGFGVSANHLISASVMSAPAALAMAKIVMPDTEKTSTSSKDYYITEKSKERNLIEAASAGALESIKLCGAIAVNVIAFLWLLEMDKSEVIATYALCGFSNINSIELMLGGLGALAPFRKSGKNCFQSHSCRKCCMFSYCLHC
ncbi:hypothetical protein KUTeg_008357, partial [Tegillarca granosa]